MALTLSDNATTCGGYNKYEVFRDSHGHHTHVLRSELDHENLDIFTNPDALAVLNDSIEDYLDGRFVDFDF